MSQQLYFSRDTKVYIAKGAAIWEIPVLDGFSFSQATNSSEITLAEMESSTGISRRGRKAFNDSLAPAEWSFSTYARPFKSAGSGAGAADNALNHHAVEEILWALLAGDATYSTFDLTGITAGLSNTVIDFGASNKSTLGTADLYFVLGNANKKVYKLAGAVVNEASFDFSIDGIASISWSGFASQIVEDTEPTATIYEGIVSTSNFIRNRLTVLTAVPTTTDPDADAVNDLEASYNMTLTGGSVTISNNISFLTPDELGTVNVPIGHVTGTRSVSGSFTCYLSKDTATANQSSDFFADMQSINNVVTNSFALTFKVGGSATTPRVEIAMPTCHIEIPTHDIADIISLSTTFMALPSTIDATDEVTVTYVGS